MKKLSPLIFIVFMTFWGCEEEVVGDITPPTVIITSPQDGSTVYEIVTITCMSSDNEGVEKVELWVNGVTTGVTDNSEPYSFNWNTTTIEDGNYTIIIRSYDTSDNTTDSEPVALTVDNSLSVPQGGNVTAVTYTITEMTVEWEQSSDGDFNNYKVLYSETENGDRDTIQTYTDKIITSHSITEFDPLIENWFWVQVTDTLGFNSIGTGMTNEINTPPTSSVLYQILYENNSYTITWSQNNDDDFKFYRLYESLSEDMTNDTLIYETDNRTDTTFINNTVQNLRYYQIVIEDEWGIQSISNIEVSDYFIELWGESYSVLNTTYLVLNDNQLTGTIPPDIGYLTNLIYLNLYNNSLTGTIPSEIGYLTKLTTLKLGSNYLSGVVPESICDLNIDWSSLNDFNISNNQLCPAYPSCIEDYVGEQDTSQCP